MQPKISIIIPTFNVELYIARCLQSCINQTLNNIEILVIDDCGSDDSIKIAQKYVQKDSRIRIIHNEKNLGTFHARANGIIHAIGEYCMFADPDDYFELNACEFAYNTIVSQQVDMVHFGIRYEPKSFKRIKPIVHYGTLTDNTMRFFLNATNNTQSLCDKIYKRHILLKAIKECAFFEPPLNMLEDGLLVLVASLESQSYFGIRRTLYVYCNNPASITKDKSLENLRKKQIHLDKLLHITSHLLAIYPQYHTIIEKYRHKVASTLMIENRDFSSFEMYESLQILHKHNLNKIYDIPPYLKSTLLSLSYAFRWQNLVRLLGFICSFGKLKL
ncbi:glycosyltransferase family 2 protein [Helicobacter japonicus]|uniref:glycosyltransferase family 2 protein n=1 Tax=Helicobacter japonicus TaxID=425400 RepID=UPI0023EF82A8|nr:glycosyltransferase family 2 protein [Helicobacter japonicus]